MSPTTSGTAIHNTIHRLEQKTTATQTNHVGQSTKVASLTKKFNTPRPLPTSSNPHNVVPTFINHKHNGHHDTKPSTFGVHNSGASSVRNNQPHDHARHSMTQSKIAMFEKESAPDHQPLKKSASSPNMVSDRTRQFEKKQTNQQQRPRNNILREDMQMVEKFKQVMKKMEEETINSQAYKEALQLHQRKSIMFKQQNTGNTWSMEDENRLQELTKLIRVEEMKQLERLEELLHSERLARKQELKSIKQSNRDSTFILQKINTEKKAMVERDTVSPPPPVQVEITGPPLSHRPLPKTPQSPSHKRTNTFCNITRPNVQMETIEQLVDDKRKRMTMTSSHDLFNY